MFMNLIIENPKTGIEMGGSPGLVPFETLKGINDQFFFKILNR